MERHEGESGSQSVAVERHDGKSIRASGTAPRLEPGPRRKLLERDPTAIRDVDDVDRPCIQDDPRHPHHEWHPWEPLVDIIVMIFPQKMKSAIRRSLSKFP
jgi:hypothetical protein